VDFAKRERNGFALGNYYDASSVIGEGLEFVRDRRN